MNKWYFSWDLKNTRVLDCRMDSGSLFHNLGTAVLNALSPYDLVLDLNSLSNRLFDDRSNLDGEYGCKSSDR